MVLYALLTKNKGFIAFINNAKLGHFISLL